MRLRITTIPAIEKRYPSGFSELEPLMWSIKRHEYTLASMCSGPAFEPSIFHWESSHSYVWYVWYVCIRDGYVFEYHPEGSSTQGFERLLRDFETGLYGDISPQEFVDILLL